MRRIVFDIETSSLGTRLADVKEIFCIAIKINDEETRCYTKYIVENSFGTLQDAYKILCSADLLIGHNIIKFDIPVIENLLGKLPTNVCDTLIDSKLLFSKDELINIDLRRGTNKDLVGKFSLKAFGERLKCNKLDYKDFTNLNSKMVEYCIRDVETTYKLYRFLVSQNNYPLEQVRKCEYIFAKCISKQEEYGFYFDIKNALEYSSKLKFSKLNIVSKLINLFPPIYVADGPIKSVKRNRKHKYKIYKDKVPLIGLSPYRIPLLINRLGKWKFPKTKWETKYFTTITCYYEENAEYQPIKLEKMNLSSRQQLIKRLEKYGYSPKEYTIKGNPKLVLNGEDYGD